ncbi:MAG: glycosyltransferase [Actinomycetota bacterium]
MKITAIILSHYKEREENLKKIINDLLNGTVKPDEVIIFIDNPEIVFNDERTTIIRSSKNFLPIVRFALGTVCETDYCLFIDDDLSVNRDTLKNFVDYAERLPNAILGLEGSILGNTDTPYTNDRCLRRGYYSESVPVDIIIRTYFVPIKLLGYGLQLRNMYPNLPKKSLDDVFLCLGNKYLGHGENFVIPVNEETDLVELPDGNVGQCREGEHYKNRNEVCRFLMDKYE